MPSTDYVTHTMMLIPASVYDDVSDHTDPAKMWIPDCVVVELPDQFQMLNKTIKAEMGEVVGVSWGKFGLDLPPSEHVLWVNEEARITPRRPLPNPVASYFSGHTTILGDVILLSSDHGGNTQSLCTDVIDRTISIQERMREAIRSAAQA